MLPVPAKIWEFPKIRGTILGVPIIRTIVFWGLYWGPLILGNYHMFDSRESCMCGGRVPSLETAEFVIDGHKDMLSLKPPE